MNSKLVLVNCITLLFRESQLENQFENSTELVKSVLKFIKIPEISMGLDPDRDILVNLRNTILSLYKTEDNKNTIELVDLLQRLRLDVNKDESLYLSLSESLCAELSKNVIKKMCGDLRSRLTEFNRFKEVESIVNQCSYSFKFAPETIFSVSNTAKDLINKLEPFTTNQSKIDPAVMGSVDLSNLDEISDIFGKIELYNNDEGILKTGWQAFNRLTDGGLRRGEFIMTCALQHQYKTGSSMAIFRHIAIYNKPIMINPTKIPVLLRISTEDSLENNFELLYKIIYENEHPGEVIKDIKSLGLSNKEIAKYVADKLSVNGYKIIMKRVDPSLWGYQDLCNLVLELESANYEIHFCQVDYLPMFSKKGCTSGPAGTDLRDLFRRVRNFFSP